MPHNAPVLIAIPPHGVVCAIFTAPEDLDRLLSHCPAPQPTQAQLVERLQLPLPPPRTVRSPHARKLIANLAAAGCPSIKTTRSARAYFVHLVEVRHHA